MIKYITAATRSLLLGLICGIYFYLSILYIVNLIGYKGPKKYLIDFLANKLKDKLIFMGPTWVKLGQFLSTRADLVGHELSDSLSMLQDNVSAFSFTKVKKFIEVELGQSMDSIFLNIEEVPIAAASVSQVHKAHLASGEQVAVKVLRPGIKRRFEADLAFFGLCAKILELCSKRMRILKPTRAISVLTQNLKIELDMRMEAAASTKVAENICYDECNVRIPKIYWGHTSKNVLIMEWIEGTPIKNREKLIAQGFDLHGITKDIAICFFNQAFRDGFFHADIHPGNILIDNTGKVCMLDFGIVSTIGYKERTFVAQTLFCLIKGEYEKLADLHFEIGYVTHKFDKDLFALACRSVGEPIVGLPVNQISAGSLLARLLEVSREFEMEVRSELVMLQKTMVTLEGIGYILYPEVNMWQLAEPWIKKWARQNLGVKHKIRVYNDKIHTFTNKCNKALDSIIRKDQRAKHTHFIHIILATSLIIYAFVLMLNFVYNI